MNTTHAKVSALADDADPSTISPSDWNADHALTIPDSGTAEQAERAVLSGTNRVTVAGTARFSLFETLRSFRGSFLIGTTEVLDDWYQLQYKRASVTGNARISISGTGELYMFDLAPVGRLVLTGRGG